MKLPIRKKHLRILVSALLILGGAIWFIAWSSSPQKGTIGKASGSQQLPAEYISKNFEGNDITFTYSSKYTLKSEGPINNDLEIHTLSASTHYDKRIIASVSKLPDRQLSSYGAYIYRKLHAESYTTRQASMAGSAAEVWVKNDGTEQTIFLPRGDKIATITLTTSSPSDELVAEFDTFLQTFRWKQ